MKITRRRFLQLVESSIRKNLLNEVKKANNWEEYVNVGKTDADKKERRKLWMMWELWTRGDTEASYALMDADMPVNPTEYTGGYEGWVEWYKDMVKNKDAMAAMGRTKHFSVADHFKYVEKYFPEKAKLPTMRIAKSKADQKVVDDFMKDINFGEKPETKTADTAQAKRSGGSKGLSIFGFSEAPVVSGAVTRAQDIASFLLTRAAAPKNLPPAQKQQYPKQAALYAKNPSLFFKLAKGIKLTAAEEKEHAALTGKSSSEKKEANEAYRRIKKLSRAQIRNIVESTFFR